jgi:hypothetical protein
MRFCYVKSTEIDTFVKIVNNMNYQGQIKQAEFIIAKEYVEVILSTVPQLNLDLHDDDDHDDDQNLDEQMEKWNRDREFLDTVIDPGGKPFRTN